MSMNDKKLSEELENYFYRGEREELRPQYTPLIMQNTIPDPFEDTDRSGRPFLVQSIRFSILPHPKKMISDPREDANEIQKTNVSPPKI